MVICAQHGRDIRICGPCFKGEVKVNEPVVSHVEIHQNGESSVRYNPDPAWETEARLGELPFPDARAATAEDARKIEALKQRDALRKRLYEEDYEPVMATRIGDKDRERYIAHLGSLFADGYLDQQEFENLNDRACAAKTHGELTALLTDLPPVPSTGPVVPEQRRRLYLKLPSAYLVLTVAAILILFGFVLGELIR
jgi:hypothetical protein